MAACNKVKMFMQRRVLKEIVEDRKIKLRDFMLSKDREEKRNVEDCNSHCS